MNAQLGNTLFTADNVVAMYTRAQAVEDGALIDVSSPARSAGIVWPVAITSAAWGDCVEWGAAEEQRKASCGQSTKGRLCDLLWQASIALRRAAEREIHDTATLPLRVLRVPRCGADLQARLAALALVIGPGDQGEPVITITLPGED